MNYEKPNEEDFGVIGENVKKMLKNSDLNSFEDLLSENDIQTMKVKYVESIESLLEDAKRRHVNHNYINFYIVKYSKTNNSFVDLDTHYLFRIRRCFQNND